MELVVQLLADTLVSAQIWFMCRVEKPCASAVTNCRGLARELAGEESPTSCQHWRGIDTGPHRRPPMKPLARLQARNDDARTCQRLDGAVGVPRKPTRQIDTPTEREPPWARVYLAHGALRS